MFSHIKVHNCTNFESCKFLSTRPLYEYPNYFSGRCFLIQSPEVHLSNFESALLEVGFLRGKNNPLHFYVIFLGQRKKNMNCSTFLQPLKKLEKFSRIMLCHIKIYSETNFERAKLKEGFCGVKKKFDDASY